MSLRNPYDNSNERDQNLHQMMNLLSEKDPAYQVAADLPPESIQDSSNWMLDELESLEQQLMSMGDAGSLSFIEEEECLSAIESARALRDLDVSNPPSADDDLSGNEVGSYLLLERIGRGGMSTVYKAIHQGLGRLVAFKTLPYRRMRQKKALARFQREMKAVGKLDHPNVVQALDAGEADGIPYLVMELVDGIDLSTLLKQSGTLAIADACAIVHQAAEALQYIHEQGMIHRDIKPSNFMLTREGRVQILDLGLAQISGELDQEELTHTGQVMGTLEYMAPNRHWTRVRSIIGQISIAWE